MNCLIFMAGGSGLRFGAKIPKQYIEVDGEPLFLYTLRKYSTFDCVEKVVIVSNADWIEYTEKYAKKVLGHKLVAVVAGGETRSHSVKNGLSACSAFLHEDDIVLIHDATNPFVDFEAIKTGIKLAKENGVSTIGTKQVHTIYRIDENNNIENIIPRENVSSGYSPELFKFGVIYPIYENADDARLEQMTSALALALQYGIKAKVALSSVVNLKITFQNDLQYFLALKKHEEATGEIDGRLE